MMLFKICYHRGVVNSNHCVKEPLSISFIKPIDDTHTEFSWQINRLCVAIVVSNVECFQEAL
jgi:hypothetical protein